MMIILYSEQCRDIGSLISYLSISDHFTAFYLFPFGKFKIYEEKQ